MQAAASEAEESQQIKIRAVSILFPLVFLGSGYSAGRKAQHLIGASKNYANLPVWVRF